MSSFIRFPTSVAPVSARDSIWPEYREPGCLSYWPLPRKEEKPTSRVLFEFSPEQGDEVFAALVSSGVPASFIGRGADCDLIAVNANHIPISSRIHACPPGATVIADDAIRATGESKPSCALLAVFSPLVCLLSVHCRLQPLLPSFSACAPPET